MSGLSPTEKEFFRYIDSFYIRSVSAGFVLWKREGAVLRTFRACTQDLKELKLLDVGCKLADLIQQFYDERNGKALIVGLDISEQFLDAASKRSQFKGHKNVCFVRQDVTHGLPFKDESFDIVNASAVLEHLLNPTPVVKEITRVLKRNGYLIVLLPSTDNLFWHMLSLIDKYVTREMMKKYRQGSYSGPTLEKSFKEHGALGHVTVFSYKEWCRIFKENGFTIDRVERGSGLLGQHPAFDRLYPLFALVLLLEPLLDYLPYKHLFCNEFLLSLKRR